MKRRIRRACQVLLVVYVALLPAVALTAPLYAGPLLPLAPSAGTPSQTVRQAQFILISHGYTGIGPADNVLGPRTRRGLRQWQRVNGLAVTGQPDAATMASLFDSTVTVTVTAPAKRLTPPALVPLGQPESAESIIRDVWPDNLEDHAVAIATRESRLQPGVINRNRDATGLFQIMWSVHRRWLCPQLGVCAQSDLQDARTNAAAALALYERDGGWGPWKL